MPQPLRWAQCLQQDLGNGMQPVAFYSHRLIGPEQNYPTHERELLAIMLALETWRHFVEGVPTTIFNGPLHLTVLQGSEAPQQTSGALGTSSWQRNPDLSIQYVRGEQNRADALSRRADMQPDSLADVTALTASVAHPDSQLMVELIAAYEDDPLVVQDRTRPHKQLERRGDLYYGSKGQPPVPASTSTTTTARGVPLYTQCRPLRSWTRLCLPCNATSGGLTCARRWQPSSSSVHPVRQPSTIISAQSDSCSLCLCLSAAGRSSAWTSSPACLALHRAAMLCGSCRDYLSKQLHFLPISKSITAEQLAQLYYSRILRAARPTRGHRLGPGPPLHQQLLASRCCLLQAPR